MVRPRGRGRPGTYPLIRIGGIRARVRGRPAATSRACRLRAGLDEASSRKSDDRVHISPGRHNRPRRLAINTVSGTARTSPVSQNRVSLSLNIRSASPSPKCGFARHPAVAGEPLSAQEWNTAAPMCKLSAKGQSNHHDGDGHSKDRREQPARLPNTPIHEFLPLKT